MVCNSFCVITELHKEKQPHLPICFCLHGPKRHLFPCVYVCAKCKVYISQSKVFYTGVTAVLSPACQTRASVLSKILSKSHVQLPAPKSRSLKTTGWTRAVRGSRVRRLRLGWKNAFFHMLLLSDLCWLVLAHCGSWMSPQRVTLTSRRGLISPMCERSGPFLLWDLIKHPI